MPRKAKLKVGAWQFAGSDDIAGNLCAMLRGIKLAAGRGIELLVMQECALTGYAGVDRDNTVDMPWQDVERAEKELSVAARAHGACLAYGTTVRCGRGAANAMRLVDARGRLRATYCKRAMYGADQEHYRPGNNAGKAALVRGIRVGLRICFEFRFPEYFRELLRARVHIGLMGFSMVGPDDRKLPVARAHIMSRAAENGIWLVAANSISRVQNAPTCIVNPDGRILVEAPSDREALISRTALVGESNALRDAIVRQARRKLNALA